MTHEQLAKLTPKEKRVKIAEACGYKKEPRKPYWHRDAVWWTIPGQEAHRTTRSVPDYLNSLDAMHEAEKTLDWQQKREYVRELFRASQSDFHSHCATAARRADAFLLTI